MIYTIIDNIRSAYNVGSIFRTADGAGDTTIYICGISPTPANNTKVNKTALGSTDSVKWEYFDTTKKCIEHLKSLNIPIYAIEITEDAIDYRDIEYPKDIAILLGHETDGVSENILSITDKRVVVPMRGKKESLNVATVAGIILYHITSTF